MAIVCFHSNSQSTFILFEAHKANDWWISAGDSFTFLKTYNSHLHLACSVFILYFCNGASGRLRLNLNPLNLVRWIDSWPFDKTWKPGWIDSTAGLWISNESSSWRRAVRESRSRRRRRIFFVRIGPVYDGNRFIISLDFRRFSRTRFTRWIFCIVKVARNEVENASFAQRSAHRDSRKWRPELIEPAVECKRRARGRRLMFKSAYRPTDFATVQYFVQLPL